MRYHTEMNGVLCERKLKRRNAQVATRRYPINIRIAEPVGISRPSRPVVLPARIEMIP
jgi:hypothetical protein